MADRTISITLTEREQQLAELAATDSDAEAALEFVRRVVKPQVDRALRRG